MPTLLSLSPFFVWLPVAGTRGDLQDKYSVLQVFGMTRYKRILFLDADTYVKGPLDALLLMDLAGKTLGVTKDIRNKKWVETFNSGVMLLVPSLPEHKRLLGLLYSGMQWEFVMADQGFLNSVYGDDWHEIGFVYNANLALYRFQRAFWKAEGGGQALEKVAIIHYTMQKPWKCRSQGPYGAICDLYKNDTSSPLAPSCS